MEVEREHELFYRNARDKSRTNLGKAIFTRLAKEEDFHSAKAAEILDFLGRGEKPLAIEESLDGGKKLRAMFKSIEHRIDPALIMEEVELIQSAIELESDSYNFYHDQRRKVKNEYTRRYFKALMYEEQVHKQCLIEYKDLVIS